MGHRGRFILVLWTILGLLALPFAGRSALAQEDAGETPAAAPPLSLNLIIDPPVGAPGQQIRVTAVLSNGGAAVETPEVLLIFPNQLAVDPAQLPAGTTLNVVTNEVTWYPVVEAAGLVQISFDFVVAVVDMTQPGQVIGATLNHNGGLSHSQASYWVGILPSATLSVSPATAAIGQELQLIANVVGPGPIVQTWTLGDGRVIEANNPIVVYPAAGVYSVTLQVANPLGATRATGIINIAPETVANFNLVDDTIAVGTAIVLENLSGGEAPLSYLWDFGDGHTSSEATPSHVYEITGSFWITLATENAYGVSSTSAQIHVGRPPTADMVLVSPAYANAPATFLAFGDESVSEFQWAMGDGTQLSGAEISHTFRRSGDYDVQLTAYNQYGATILTQRVSVGPGTWTIHLPVALNPGVVVAAPEGAAAAPVADTSLAPELGPESTIPEQLLWFVNEARRLHGLLPVAYSYELTVAAQQHTDDMAINGYTGHSGFDGSTPPERLQRFGYTGFYAGEATAWGFDRPIPVVEFWVNSPGHRDMILNPEATEIGIGYTYNPNAPNVWYWTVEFGKRSPDSDASTDTLNLVAERPRSVLGS